jgi:hypothetical protein
MEVRRTVATLKRMGYSGVILVYARELGLNHDAVTQLKGEPNEDETSLKDVQLWKEGTLETVRLASPGDFVSVKYGFWFRPFTLLIGAGLPAMLTPVTKVFWGRICCLISPILQLASSTGTRSRNS